MDPTPARDQSNKKIQELHKASARQKQIEGQLRFENRLARILSTHIDRPDLLNRLLAAILELDGITAGCIHFVDHRTKSLELVSHIGLTPSDLTMISCFESQSPQADLIRSGKPYYGARSIFNASMDQSHRAQGWRSIGIIPILSGHQPIANLCVLSPDHGQIPRPLKHILASATHLIGGFLAHLKGPCALSAHNQKHRHIFENIQDVYYEITLEGKILELSPSIKDISGYDREELIGRSLYSIFADDYERDAFISELIARKKLTDYEITIFDKDRTRHVCSVISNLVTDNRDHPQFVVGSLRNITGRKRMEEALRESEKTLSAILAASPVGIGLARNRTLKWGNKAFYDMLGYEEGSLSGSNIRRIYPDDETYEQVGRVLYTGLRHKGLEQIETRWKTRDGITIDCHLQASTLDPLDPAKGVLFAAMDISKRKQAENALRESEAQKKAILDASLDWIRHVDRNMNILWYNRKTDEALQLPPEKILGRPCYQVLVGRDAPCESCPTVAAMKSGRIEKSIMRYDTFYNLDAESFWESYSVPLKDEDGAIVSFIQISKNITDQMQAMAALQESKEKYFQLFENEADAVMIIDADTLRFEDANQAALNLYGYSKEEFLGLKVTDISEEKDKTRVAMRKIIHDEPGGDRVPIRSFRKKDGTIFPGEIYAGKYKSGNHIKIIGAVRDVTDRLQANVTIHTLSQEQLKAQENERLKISRYLHDQVAQDLSSLKISCETMFDRKADIPADIRQKVTEMSGLLQNTIAAVRDLSYDLRPPGMDHLGLTRTLVQYCEDYHKKNNLRIDFFSAGMDDLQVDYETEINLFRVVQEALNNINQHAEANTVTVRLVASFPSIILRIEDNGKGFSVDRSFARAAAEKRMGLRNIQERVRLLDGELGIQSSPGNGTKIVVEIPVQEKQLDREKMCIDH